MAAYLLRRLLQTVPTMIGVILLVFVLFNVVGGDPAYLLAGKISNPEQIAQIRRELGLDEPWWRQLLLFVQQALTFDFGRSWSTFEPVSSLFASRLPPSLLLGLSLMVIETAIALALAVAVVRAHGRLADRAVMVLCTVAQSVSILVYIIVFQYLFAYRFGWFPVQGWGDDLAGSLRYAALPVLIGVVVSLAPDIRLYRTFLLDEIQQDYVRTARAKGASPRRVMVVHVLRNAAIPVVTTLMTQLPLLLVGLFLIERFFSIPGIGREVILAVERSDFPVIKAITVYVALATLAANLVADVLYKAFDPRVALDAERPG